EVEKRVAELEKEWQPQAQALSQKEEAFKKAEEAYKTKADLLKKYDEAKEAVSDKEKDWIRQEEILTKAGRHLTEEEMGEEIQKLAALEKENEERAKLLETQTKEKSLDDLRNDLRVKERELLKLKKPIERLNLSAEAFYAVIPAVVKNQLGVGSRELGEKEKQEAENWKKIVNALLARIDQLSTGERELSLRMRKFLLDQAGLAVSPEALEANVLQELAKEVEKLSTKQYKTEKENLDKAVKEAQARAKEVGKVNLNEADQESLEKVEGLTPEMARTILEYRRDGFSIRRWTDLRMMLRMTPEDIQKLKEHALLGEMGDENKPVYQLHREILKALRATPRLAELSVGAASVQGWEIIQFNNDVVGRLEKLSSDKADAERVLPGAEKQIVQLIEKMNGQITRTTSEITKEKLRTARAGMMSVLSSISEYQRVVKLTGSFSEITNQLKGPTSIIFGALVDLLRNNRGVDHLSVAQDLNDLNQLGRAYLKLNAAQQAEVKKAIERLIGEGVDHERLFRYLDLLTQNTENPSHLLMREYEERVSQDPSNIEVALTLVSIYRTLWEINDVPQGLTAQDLLSKAAASYKAVLAIDPQNAIALSAQTQIREIERDRAARRRGEKAEQLLKEGKIDEAIQELASALKSVKSEGITKQLEALMGEANRLLKVQEKEEVNKMIEAAMALMERGLISLAVEKLEQALTQAADDEQENRIRLGLRGIALGVLQGQYKAKAADILKLINHLQSIAPFLTNQEMLYEMKEILEQYEAREKDSKRKDLNRKDRALVQSKIKEAMGAIETQLLTLPSVQEFEASMNELLAGAGSEEKTDTSLAHFTEKVSQVAQGMRQLSARPKDIEHYLARHQAELNENKRAVITSLMTMVQAGHISYQDLTSLVTNQYGSYAHFRDIATEADFIGAVDLLLAGLSNDPSTNSSPSQRLDERRRVHPMAQEAA
ncbi:MAG: helix-hairpin-helix domain-containing protein, partial [Chlamydiae bacterium]|nr:helix-hairpin-helix domain-containing protein [Chlamydiota bacterium]